MYDVIFDSNPLDFLSKLPTHITKRIFDKIVTTKENPHRYFQRLVGRSDYKLRVGNFRVVADIDDHNKKIEITLIDKRSKIY